MARSAADATSVPTSPRPIGRPVPQGSHTGPPAAGPRRARRERRQALGAVPPDAPAPGGHDLPPEVPLPRGGCPVTGAATAPPAPDGPGPALPVEPVDPAEAEDFLRLFHAESPAPPDPAERLAAVADEIARTGTYVHTGAELAFGAQIAWRNAARCIGRLYWRSLHVRDRRHVRTAAEVADECVAHLREATRRGRIRSTLTVLAPDTPASRGPRIHNDQLVRYAGYRDGPDGHGGAGAPVLGDPRQVALTDHARRLGWEPPATRGRFDVLPLLVTGGGPAAADGPVLAEVPADAVLEVGLVHPDHDWFADLGLRWHAVPAIANMTLEIGGVAYPAAPFNGWYMSTEIGARNLADGDRYDLLREVAHGMGLDTRTDRSMWRDRAAVELTLAVQYSFDTAGVSMADHHGESQRFLRHLEREESAGRRCPVDWSWIVPPISGGLTPVFHRYYDPPTDAGPRFRM